MKSLTSLITLIVVLMLTGCATKNLPQLRIGVSPDYPPVIFKKDGKITGMEADFARALSSELEMETKFIEIPFDQTISSLKSGKIDIIMSGMSVTEKRAQQVNFCDPYFTISQMLLVRRREMGNFKKPGKGYYIRSNMTVGVEAGTTGEEMAKKYLTNNRIKVFKDVDKGSDALKQGKIDCFLHDAPTIWQYTDGSDPVLAGVYWEFGKEKLAWAISKSNPELLLKVRKITQKWQFNGITSRIVSKWIPQRVTYK